LRPACSPPCAWARALPRGLQGLDNGGWLGLPMQDPHLLYAGHLTCARASRRKLEMKAQKVYEIPMPFNRFSRFWAARNAVEAFIYLRLIQSRLNFDCLKCSTSHCRTSNYTLWNYGAQALVLTCLRLWRMGANHQGRAGNQQMCQSFLRQQTQSNCNR
jgi:hypothetical protein